MQQGIACGGGGGTVGSRDVGPQLRYGNLDLGRCHYRQRNQFHEYMCLLQLCICGHFVLLATRCWSFNPGVKCHRVETFTTLYSTLTQWTPAACVTSRSPTPGHIHIHVSRVRLQIQSWIVVLVARCDSASGFILYAKNAFHCARRATARHHRHSNSPRHIDGTPLKYDDNPAHAAGMAHAIAS